MGKGGDFFNMNCERPLSFFGKSTFRFRLEARGRERLEIDSKGALKSRMQRSAEPIKMEGGDTANAQETNFNSTSPRLRGASR